MSALENKVNLIILNFAELGLINCNIVNFKFNPRQRDHTNILMIVIKKNKIGDLKKLYS
jgi:hypothetical protein